jgi:hypothetical protein
MADTGFTPVTAGKAHQEAMPAAGKAYREVKAQALKIILS